jgi:hypothetical protein
MRSGRFLVSPETRRPIQRASEDADVAYGDCYQFRTMRLRRRPPQVQFALDEPCGEHHLPR